MSGAMGGPSSGWALAWSTRPGAWRPSKGSSECRMMVQPQLTRYRPQLRSLAESLAWFRRSVAQLREGERMPLALPPLIPAHSAGILPSHQDLRIQWLAVAARKPFSRRPQGDRNAEMALAQPRLHATSWVWTRT